MKAFSHSKSENQTTDGETPSLPRRYFYLFLIALVILVCVTDWGFVRDSYFLEENFEFLFGPRVVGGDWRTILLDHPHTTTIYNRYRPFELLSYTLLEMAFGINHRYHFAFLSLLKIIGALSLFFCARKVFKCTIPAMVAALLFAADPVMLWTFRGLRHITVLLIIFIFWTWFFYEKYLETGKRKYRLIALAFNLIALMYNELAFMLPPFMLLYGFMRDPRKPTPRLIKEAIVKPCYPFFILAGAFAVFSFLVGGLGAYRPPFTMDRLWINLGYLFFRIPAAFLDLWDRGLFVSTLNSCRIYWGGLWIMLLILSLGSSFKKTLWMMGISLVFYTCFMAPVFQLLHTMFTPRFATGVAGLCLFSGSLFNWAEKNGRWRAIPAIVILALMVTEFSASTISFWKKRYQENAGMIKVLSPSVADYVLRNYPSAPPGSVFVIMVPDREAGNSCADSFIKSLGGRPLSRYLFLAVHPRAERGLQVLQVPEILWDAIWCDPVKEETEYPVITWIKSTETSITFREALQSEYMEGIMWISRDGLRWKQVETSPPTLETCLKMGWNAYYLKLTDDGRITDLGPAEKIEP